MSDTYESVVNYLGNKGYKTNDQINKEKKQTSEDKIQQKLGAFLDPTQSSYSKEDLNQAYILFWEAVGNDPSYLNNPSSFENAVNIFELGINIWGKDALIKAETNGGSRIQDNTEARSTNLITIKGDGGVNYQADWRAAVASSAMAKAAYRDGISTDLLLLTSGYRSDASQKPLWDAKVAQVRQANPEMTDAEVEKAANRWVARPGTSRHRSGRALDLKMDSSLTNSQENAEALKKTETFKWMQKNAATYGFYNYPVEAWHWEYNP